MTATVDTAVYADVVLGDRPGFLAVAYGHDPYRDDAGKYRHRQWTERRYPWPDQREALHTDVSRMLAAGERADVYVCPAVRFTDDRRKGSALPPMVCWADLDGPVADLELLSQLDPLLVESGSEGHRHAYLPLSRPLGLGAHARLNKALAARLGGDAKWSDEALLRLPGSLNHKTDPPTVVTPLPWSGRVWEPAELAALLGVDLSTTAGASSAPAPVVSEPVPESLPALVRWALDHPEVADRSAAHHRLVGACRRAGLTAGQTLTLAGRYPPSVEKYRDRLTDEVVRSWSVVDAVTRDGIYELIEAPPPATNGASPPAPARRPQPAARTRDDFSDARMAQTVADDVLDGWFVWCKGLGWLRWGGQRWEDATEETVGEALRVYVLDRFGEAVSALREGTTEGATGVDGWRSMLSAGRQRGVLTLARGIVERRAEQFDADPEVLNTPVGIVHLVTGVVFPHDPAALITKITRGSYRPGFTHADWHSALAALPADKALWYQVRIGQAITGHPTPDGVLVLLQGGGENGKSLLSTDGLLPALGDYADAGSAKLITATRGTEHSTEMADLRGKRLLVAEEMTEGRALNITAIKRVQDVTLIKARYVHRDNFTFPASHSLFVTTNYVPRVDETDHGTWRRLALLRFPYTFRKPAEPLDSPSDRRGDPELKARIRAGASGQHDAIVTWAVEGALRATNKGAQALAVPASVAADTRAWRAVADRILGYWTERLIPEHGCCVLATELLEDFNDWLKTNGHQAWSKETFVPKFQGHTETARHGVELRRQLHPEGLVRRPGDLMWMEKPVSGRVRVWHGVRYRTPADQQEDDPLPEVSDPLQNLSRACAYRKFPEGSGTSGTKITKTSPNGSSQDPHLVGIEERDDDQHTGTTPRISLSHPETEPRCATCGQALLLRIEGRTQCERCRLKAPTHPDADNEEDQ